MIGIHQLAAIAASVGMAWPDLVTLSTSTTATGGALNLVDQIGGTALTITLPAANSVTEGTPLGLIVINAAWFTNNTITAASGDYIGATGTGTTLALGFNNSDYAAVLVSNGVDRWIRQDQATNTTANGVSATGDLYIGSGGSTYFNVYGANGLTLNATGGAVTINAGSWVTLGTSLGVVLPSKTSAEITAFVLPPTGVMVANTTTGQLWINLGTPASPVWHYLPTVAV